MASNQDGANGITLRSQAWWDNSAHPDMTALYLERFLNYGLTRQELQSNGMDAPTLNGIKRAKVEVSATT